MQFKLQINPDSTRYASLEDTEYLMLPNREHTQHLYKFPIKSYSKLKMKLGDEFSDENSGWISIFGYVNVFFSTLTEEEQLKVALTYALIHMDCDNYYKKNDIYQTSSLIAKISDRLLLLDKEIDLVRKMYRFVVDSDTIKIGVMENAGSRPQDSKELTFHDDEVMLVATLAMLCKAFCPIFGLLINILASNLSPTLQDVHCSGIFTGIINAHDSEFEPILNLKAVTEKLKHYIEHQAAQICRNDIDSSIVAGYDVHSLAYSLYCKLLVRKLVGISLANRESNIMAFIVVYVRNCTRQTISGTKSKNPTMLREDKETESEDGNTARLETDSMTSKKTADITDLVTAFVDPAVTRVMDTYDISQEEIKMCLDWYQTHPIVPNCINKQLNSLQYGQDFGGSLGIQMLIRPEFSLITVLLQLVMMKQVETLRDDEKKTFGTLVHLLTAQPSISVTMSGLNGNNVWLQTAGSVHYHKCLQKFQNSTVTNKNKAWENHIKNLIEEVTVEHYAYNSAPYIYECLGQDVMNGKVIPIDANVFKAYCFYYNWELENREQQRLVVG